ncbi:hypothetical protein Tco_0568516 [Tanacetum coccineum]
MMKSLKSQLMFDYQFKRTLAGVYNNKRTPVGANCQTNASPLVVNKTTRALCGDDDVEGGDVVWWGWVRRRWQWRWRGAWRRRDGCGREAAMEVVDGHGGDSGVVMRCALMSMGRAFKNRLRRREVKQSGEFDIVFKIVNEYSVKVNKIKRTLVGVYNNKRTPVGANCQTNAPPFVVNKTTRALYGADDVEGGDVVWWGWVRRRWQWRWRGAWRRRDGCGGEVAMEVVDGHGGDSRVVMRCKW